MKRFICIALAFFGFSYNCCAETTYYSDGSYSQSTADSRGNSTTYYSDGSWSQG